MQQKTEELQPKSFISNLDIQAYKKYLPKTPYTKYTTDVNMSKVSLFEDKFSTNERNLDAETSSCGPTNYSKPKIVKKRDVVIAKKLNNGGNKFDIKQNNQDDFLQTKKDTNDFSMMFNQEKFYQNILNGSDYAINNNSDAYDLNDNLDQSDISHHMNSVCLQTGNFGGNISMADNKNNSDKDTVQNEITTQTSS